MKKWLILAVFLGLAFTGFSCGGGGGGGSSSPAPNTPPSISNLRSPASVGLNSGGGTIPLTVTVDFNDPDGNVSTYTVSVAGGRPSTKNAVGVAGFTSGPLDITFDINTTALGNFTFTVFVTDSRGANSSTLSGGFAVREILQAKAAMPTARDSLVTASLNGKIYAIGGNGAVLPYLNSTEEYDVALDRWSVRAPMPTERAESAIGAANGKIYVIGGYNGGPITLLNTVEEYDPIADAWTAKSPMPTTRAQIAAAVLDEKIYVMGGQKMDATLTAIGTLEVYDPALDSWKTLAPMPTARLGLAAVAINGKIYALGGETADGIITDKVEEYDPATDTWKTKASLPVPKYDLAAAAANGKIYTIGGWSPGLGTGALRQGDTVYEYDPVTDTWKSKAFLYPPGRHDLGVSAVNEKIYAIGGEAQTERYLNRVDEYNPANDI